MDLKIWKLHRESPGYEEISVLVLVAGTETEARAWAVKHSRNQKYAADWMFPDESTCVAVGTPLEIFSDGEIIATDGDQ